MSLTKRFVDFVFAFVMSDLSDFWRDSPGFFVQMFRIPLNHGNVLLFCMNAGNNWGSGRGLVLIQDSVLYGSWIRSPHWAWFAFED